MPRQLLYFEYENRSGVRLVVPTDHSFLPYITRDNIVEFANEVLALHGLLDVASMHSPFKLNCIWKDSRCTEVRLL